MYNIIYKNILNGKEYVRSKSSAMTLSVGHFKGRYEAWNWKYLMEDTITMTMELELQVEEGSVNSQGKFVYLNTIWALESKVIESCYSHSSFFQIMWFVKPQNYPFSFFLQTLPPSIFPPIQQPTILPNSTLSPLFVFVLQAWRVVFFFWHLDATEYWLHFCLLFKLVELFWSNYLSYHQEVRPDIHV